MRHDEMRGVPRDINAMRAYFEKVFEVRSHVVGVRTNAATNALQINCLWSVTGVPDVFLPVKRGKLYAATALLEKIVSEILRGYHPSDSDVMQLFDLVDLQMG